MRVIKQRLPGRCFGKRRKDTSPDILPEGELAHYISDRWEHYGTDPYSIASILSILRDYKLSYHELIDRDGTVIVLVPTEPLCYRAWHAGESIWNGRDDCNDWMIGTALVGMYGEPFTDAQYDSYAQRIGERVSQFPTRRENVTGHEHVAPDSVRGEGKGKPDPGPSFDWDRLNDSIAGFWRPAR